MTNLVMNDNNLIKKYNLEEAVKRFQQINEYTFITEPPMVTEDGEEDNEPNNNQNQSNDIQGNDNGMETPQPNNNQQQLPMGNDEPNDNMEMNNTDMGEMPNIGGEDIEIETEEETDFEEGDEVIDVDDLTQSQEATEIKVDDVEGKLEKMMSFIDKVENAINLSNKKIDDLRKEFEKRNPTEEEILNLRSQASFPYSETPREYMDKKLANNPHYKVVYDNEKLVDEPKKYEITADEVNSFNPKTVADSFDIDKEYKLSDFLNF